MPPPGRPSMNGKKRQVVQDSDDEQDAFEQRLPKYADVSPEYLNQPIITQLGTTQLRALIHEIERTRDALLGSLSSLSDVAQDFASAAASLEDDNQDFDDENIPQDPAEIQRVDKEIRVLLDKKEELEIVMRLLSDMRQRLAQGHQITDVWSAYKTQADTAIDAYKQKTSRMKYAENQAYVEFKTAVFEALYHDRGVPSMKRLIPKKDGDEDDDDDEIEVGNIQQSFRCPLTAGWLKKAMTSKKCVHSFSGDAIREHLKNGPQACPISGCPKHFNSIDDLKEDKALQKRADAFQKRQAGPGGTQRNTQYETIDDDSDDE